MNEKDVISLPGQRLCLSDQVHVSGHGTYERQGYIYSSLAGTVSVVAKNGVKVVEVHSVGEQTSIPMQGDVVTAQVCVCLCCYYEHVGRFGVGDNS